MEARTRPVPMITRAFSGTGIAVRPVHVVGGKQEEVGWANGLGGPCKARWERKQGRDGNQRISAGQGLIFQAGILEGAEDGR